jgi:oligopeptide transport system substrate-binding protein
MFLTGGENNETGWSNKTYDRLIEVSTTEADSGKRMKILRDAERILMDELPIIPIYFYVSTNLVRPYVKGFDSNSRDSHPLWNLSIDKEEKQRIFAAEGLR